MVHFRFLCWRHERGVTCVRVRVRAGGWLRDRAMMWNGSYSTRTVVLYVEQAIAVCKYVNM